MSAIFDEEGFVIELAHWNKAIATQIAEGEGISLSDEHWEIIEIVREYYREYELSPVNRTLIKAVKMKLGEEKGNSIYLMSLFTGTPAKIVAKIAGLPKPSNCL